MRVSWIVLAVVLVSGTPAWAQSAAESEVPAQTRVDETAAVEVGGRVRVRTRRASGDAPAVPTAPATLTGEILAIDQDNFVLKLDGRLLEVTIPRSAVSRIEHSQGKVRVGSRVKSALKGLALGAAAGWLLGEAFPTCRVGGTDPFCDATTGPTDGRAKDKSNSFAAWFGAAGAVSGAWIGGRKVEQWKGASFEAPPTKPVAISIRGLGASIRISF